MLTCTNAQAEEILRLRMEGGGHSTTTNATEPLPHESWQDWDENIRLLQLGKLGVFGDLSNRVSRAVAVHLRQYVYQSATGDFEGHVSMDFERNATGNRVLLTDHITPVPVHAQEFEYKAREIEAVMSQGGQYDNAGRVASVRAVMEMLEDLVLDGPGVTEGNATNYGLKTYPDRVQASVSGGALATTDGFGQWEKVVKQVVSGLEGKNFTDEAFMLYVNSNDWAQAKINRYNIYDASMVSDAVQRLDGVMGVVSSSKVPANRVIAVVPDQRTVTIPYAMPIAIRQRARLDIRDPYEFVTEAIAGIALKSDAKQNTGIVDVTVS